jgi:serine/threonine protein kinase
MKGRHQNRVSALSEDEKLELLSSLIQLRHPGLVRFHRFVMSEDTLYSVMERCCGLTLPDRISLLKDAGSLASGALPVAEVRSLAQQILSALAALHTAKLMHRDLKLDNFRFADESSRRLKILDFGFVKATNGEPAQHTVTGTLLYAAPEVFDGFYCHSCDVWSAGTVLFHLLSGQLPFETSDVVILRSMHRDPILMGDCLFRGKSWDQVPSVARGLVRQLLTVDPEKRPSAGEAVKHPWLSGAEANHGSSGSLPALLSRSMQSFENLQRSLVGLKRCDVKWNLAEVGKDDGSRHSLLRQASSASSLRSK